MFCTRIGWVCLVCLPLCKEEESSTVSLQFWDWDYVSQLPYVWYYAGVKSSFQHAREECESKTAYTCVAGSVIFYLSSLCVVLSMDLFALCVVCLTVFVSCLVKPFAICLGVDVFCCLMLWKCSVWMEVLCWIYSEWSFKECVCCSCDPSVHISDPSIGCSCCASYLLVCCVHLPTGPTNYTQTIMDLSYLP